MLLTPSESVSSWASLASKGSSPYLISSISGIPSLSSSVSALSPMLSPSLSNHSLGSLGKASLLSTTPSLSVS
jgi:hypothetical protein